MAIYQSFPGEKGSSNSIHKLESLPFPPLNGLSFLDIGCNEGYFCGYAFFEGARSVTGVDNNPLFINKAKLRFPHCNFVQSDWMEFLNGTDNHFDVILCSSAIHYAPDQARLVQAMVGRLAPRGVLLLEIGIATQDAPCIVGMPKPGWALCKRSIDERLFPTWAGLEAMLEPYAWKHAGESAPQIGDSLARHVFQISKILPYAIFIFGDPASGKTTAARKIFNHLPLVRGDCLWIEPNPEKFPGLASVAAGRNGWKNINQLVNRLFESGHAEEYAALIMEKAGYNDFVFEGYIPAEFRKHFIKLFEKANYMPMNIEMDSSNFKPWQLQVNSRLEAHKYNLFLAASSSRIPKHLLKF